MHFTIPHAPEAQTSSESTLALQISASIQSHHHGNRQSKRRGVFPSRLLFRNFGTPVLTQIKVMQVKLFHNRHQKCATIKRYASKFHHRQWVRVFIYK